MIYKCKMCGGNLNVAEGSTTVVCEYCGTQQTIPSASNEKKINLFNRANALRLQNDFDKAGGLYENIVSEYKTEAEAYWGLCLCKYGIEYVNDPVTRAKIPTCHRTLIGSIFLDSDYKNTIKYASASSSEIYQREAALIDSIQKSILNISSKEKPYDVFICYKETDSDGNRTKDSVLAQKLYDELTAKKLKVFFARITLESKLGQEYEPYIFAALISSKVMLAVGTSRQNMESVWVKNEWTRFLHFMQHDKSKVLIPCYCEMDAYELPQEMLNLQGQDLSKLGFEQDITRGILKILGKDQENSQSTEYIVNQAELIPIIKRAYIDLEEGNFNSASNRAEKVLDKDPENAYAYMIQFLASLKLTSEAQIVNLEKTLSFYPMFIRAKKYAKGEYLEKLNGFANEVDARIERKHIENSFSSALENMKNKRFTEALGILEKNPTYKNSSELIEMCNQFIKKEKDELVYKQAEDAEKSARENIDELKKALEIFESLGEFRDAVERAESIKKAIEDIKAKIAEEKKAQELKERAKRQKEIDKFNKSKKIMRILMPVACSLAVIMAVVLIVIGVLN